MIFVLLKLSIVYSSNTTQTTITSPSTAKTQTATTAIKTPTEGVPTTSQQPTKAPLNCSAFAECSTCTDDSHCYWCGPSKQCLHYPKGKIIPKGCSGNKWYWKQCAIPGFVLIIIVPSLGGLILLLCGCCIYCKCCRTSSKSWKKEEERITQRRKDRQLRNDDKKADRQKRADALRMKYGLLKSDDEEPLI